MRLFLILTALICATNISLIEAAKVNSMQAHIFDQPLIIGKGATEVMHIAIAVPQNNQQSVNVLQIHTSLEKATEHLQSAALYRIGTKGSARREMIATGTIKKGVIEFDTPMSLTLDTTWFAVSLSPRNKTNLDVTFHIEKISARLNNNSTITCLLNSKLLK